MTVSRLERIAQVIDGLNERIGRAVAWLTLAMVLVQFVVVVMRYVFGLSILVMQESIVYMHALVFLLAAGYTLLHDGHVRVDIMYGSASERTKATIDFWGSLLILTPVCILIWWTAWPYVAAAWRVREGSVELSGIQGVYLLKTSILVFATLVLLQGISLAIKSFLAMRGMRSSHVPEIRTPEELEEHGL